MVGGFGAVGVSALGVISLPVRADGARGAVWPRGCEGGGGERAGSWRGYEGAWGCAGCGLREGLWGLREASLVGCVCGELRGERGFHVE